MKQSPTNAYSGAEKRATETKRTQYVLNMIPPFCIHKLISAFINSLKVPLTAN